MELKTGAMTDLPCDKLMPELPSNHSVTNTLQLDVNTYAVLQRFCAENNVTLAASLFAAFRATHFHLTGLRETILGAVVVDHSGMTARSSSGTLVQIRSVIEGQTYDELVLQVQEQMAAHVDQSNVSSEPVSHSNNLECGRTSSEGPASIQSALVVHGPDNLNSTASPDSTSPQQRSLYWQQLDLEVHIFPCGDTMGYEASYSQDTFQAETVQNFLAIFRTVLEAGLARRHDEIESMDLLSDDGLHQLKSLDLLGPAQPTSSREFSIVDLFKEQVSLRPERVAVKDTSTQLTYAELDKFSTRIAIWLLRRALAQETLVGVFAPRSCETVVAFLGILKANMAYLPFDVNTPTKRMEAILGSIQGPKLILTGSALQRPTVPDAEFLSIADVLQQVEVDEDSHYCTPDSPSAPSLAYVMYTSGSTGTPKGVMVEHRGIVQLVAGSNITEYLCETPVVAHITNLAFDLSTWEIFSALLNGGTLVCIDATVALDFVAISDTFLEQHVQTAILTPALLKQYISQCPSALSNLSALLVGGDKADPQDLVALRKFMPGHIINIYGPTENSIISTYYCYQQGEDYSRGVPIGRAISGTGAYVVNKNLRLVPPGVVGELILTGDGLARGYVDPLHGAGRFTTIDIGQNLNVKAYRTGDYARCRPTDGQMEFLGRTDGQIKLRGHRIELGEIEHCLRAHHSISDAAVILMEREGKAQLAGFVSVYGTMVSTAGSDEHDAAKLVETWEEVFTKSAYHTIEQTDTAIIGRDFVGWVSMIDGEDVDKTEMSEWLDDTIATMLNGGAAREVLEIGTGSGMVLFNLDEGLQSYTGLDPSKNVVAYAMQAIQTMPLLRDKAKIYEGTAADLNSLPKSVSPNLVVVNGVVQYFPSLEYLFTAIVDILELGSVETIFFGDIRPFSLDNQHRVSRAMFKADQDTSKAELRASMEAIEREDVELMVDPAFFTSLKDRLPGKIHHVEILPKRMRACNEFSCYRYAAAIHLQTASGVYEEVRRIADTDWVDFQDAKMDNYSLSERLRFAGDASTIAVSNITFKNTIFERHIIESLDEKAEDRGWIAAARLKALNRPSMAVFDLQDLAALHGYRVETSWARQSSQHGGLDVIFHRYRAVQGERVMFRFPTDHGTQPVRTFSSNPLKVHFNHKTQDELFALLNDRLPSYMVPRFVDVMDALPLNANGKIDRTALAARCQDRSVLRSAKDVQKPSSNEEQKMQRIFARVLRTNQDSFGVNNSFFQLGGSSIMAMKLVAQARKQGLWISAADVFRSPTVAALAHVASAVDDKEREITNIEHFSLLDAEVDIELLKATVSMECNAPLTDIEDIYPCTPLQAGMMSLSSKRVSDYIFQGVFELPEINDLDAYKSAWDSAVRASDMLRTTIVQHNQLGFLHVVLNKTVQWTEAEVLEKYLALDKANPMKLGGHLTRFALVDASSSESSNESIPRYLVLTMHHAMFDGWSLHLMMKNVERALVGQSPRAGIPFRSFLKHLQGEQDRTLDIKGQSGNRDSAAQVYWKSVFDDDVMRIVFPVKSASTKQMQVDGWSECEILLQSTSGSEVTISTVARAALALSISRYTGEKDIIFGAVVSGRNASVSGIEEIVGPTIATVPLRIKLSRAQTVEDYLGTVQTQAIDMMPYEQTGLQNIAKVSDKSRDGCAVETLLVVQPEETENLGDRYPLVGRFSSFASPGGDKASRQGMYTYSLTIECFLKEGAVKLRAAFDTSVMPTWQMQRFLTQMGATMKSLLEVPSRARKLEDFDSLAEEDLEHLWAWNESVPERMNRCLHDLITQQAREQPRAPAVCGWDGELSYGELEAFSDGLAHRLLYLGVKAEEAVPVCFEKSMWTVVAMLAVLKAGAAFVPLDAEQAQDRRRSVLDQVNARIVLSSPAHRDMLLSTACSVLVVDRDTIAEMQTTMILRQGLNAEQEHQGGRHIVDPAQMAYIIFTSGSTGTPKGVILEHRAVSTSCLNHGEQAGVSKASRVLQFASYTFDASIFEIFTTLVHGGCVCTPSDPERLDDLAGAMRMMHVNFAVLTPTVAQTLRHADVPALQSLMLCGESVSRFDVSAWQGLTTLLNGYGPTESAVCAALTVLNRDVGANDVVSDTIGYSVGCATWVVDQSDHDKLMPPGMVGELLLEGSVLARGYLGDDEKTSRAFIDDPAWLLAGTANRAGRRGRLYKTGDLVRYREDGRLAFVGRKDTQVKIGGQRVELGEVEVQVLSCVPTAKHVAAALVRFGEGRGEGRREEMLAAFVELGEDGSAAATPTPFGTDSLRALSVAEERVAELRQRLPRHMMPKVLFAVHALPTTTSGKLDRRLLAAAANCLTAPQLAELRIANQERRREPSTEAERMLCGVWARVFGVEYGSIGVDDNFFDLGGDSISAMKLVAEARRDRGGGGGVTMSLSVRDVFQRPTISGLALLQAQHEQASVSAAQLPPAFSLVDERVREELLASMPAAEQGNVVDILPLTGVQSAIVRDGVSRPLQSLFYFHLDIGSQVDVDNMTRSCRRLLEYNSMLRSSFMPAFGEYWQIVHESLDAPVDVLDTHEDLHERTFAFCLEDTKCRFSYRGLPVRFTILRSQSQGCRLIIRLSHAQYDGLSMPTIFEPLMQLYHGQPVEPLAEFSLHLQMLRGADESSLRYWRQLLHSAKMTAVTPLLCDDSVLLAREIGVAERISVRKVIPTPRPPQNITLTSLVTAAWATVLSNMTANPDVVYAVVAHNRNTQASAGRLIAGPCFNMIPFRSTVCRSRTPHDLMASSQEQYLCAEPCDWERIVSNCTDWPADTIHDPLFVCQNIDANPTYNVDGIPRRLEAFDNPLYMLSSMVVVAFPEKGRLTVAVTANSHILSEETGSRLVNKICEAIESFSVKL